MTSACMHIMACTHQVIIMSTGKLSLPETGIVTVKSGDRQVITTGDRHRSSSSQVVRVTDHHASFSSQVRRESGTKSSQVRRESGTASQVKSGPERIRDRVVVVTPASYHYRWAHLYSSRTSSSSQSGGVLQQSER